ncbi:cytochrome P450 [Saccharopolyspora elongata]|uniref:Cytochrome P450 n=1 Tax=Saccharopolyspora elongata TaxID=2530387 RepID=A0A4R4XYY1_9PSEU|nr:cytochrome P450 [Saccharopolyspora elongata]TDD36269.1 cytochrome P450 [Saccharopolyspora elongata]
MFTAYGSEHRRLRSLLSKAFTPSRVEKLRPAVEQITDDLLDGLAMTPRGEPVDLRKRFAYPLPAEVICQLFGVPDAPRVPPCASPSTMSSPPRPVRKKLRPLDRRCIAALLTSLPPNGKNPATI